LGRLDNMLTGRVFTANGPWVIVNDDKLRALMPNMLAHRTAELPYYERVLKEIAHATRLTLDVVRNEHRWEGLADVTVIDERAVLTHTVPGHYDVGLATKTLRSSLRGVQRAADFAGLHADQCLYAELVYPHFHGDTVHFTARTRRSQPVLFHYPAGLYGDESEHLRRVLGEERVHVIDKTDAVDAYAANARQVLNGVLVPEGTSTAFRNALQRLELDIKTVALNELFGKAGGGPACATLYLPANLDLPIDSPLRYSVSRPRAIARRDRVAERVRVDPGYFVNRPRG
jgi:hypothetical protein